MPEGGRYQVYDQRLPLLQLGSDHERRGSRRYSEGERERLKHRVDEHES